MPTIHVVSHTHWDREWYHSAERFRQRLVALVDALLESSRTESGSFLLDGQTVVLDDVLTVRPEQRVAIAALLQRGSIEAGPWFVLADALIPSGESLVRNLLAGRRTLAQLGATAPPVLYCPDSFGHPAALPTLAQGFGCDVIVAWRGFGSSRAPQASVLWWVAPSGERAILHHLSRSGYELGANLPSADAAVRERWASIASELMPRAGAGPVLLLNGADHHARQSDLAPAIAALTRAAAPIAVKPSSLKVFARELMDVATRDGSALPTIRGELRDSYGFTWTLQGTFASRAGQKRRAALAACALVRDVEPWVALAAVADPAGAARREALLRAAWHSLLLCHPHDTLCGCSTDDVARAMDARLAATEAQAAGLRQGAIHDLIGYRADDARERKADWTPVTLVRNPAPRARGGVALLRVSEHVAHVRVGPPDEGTAAGHASASGSSKSVDGPVDSAVEAAGLAVVAMSRGTAVPLKHRRPILALAGASVTQILSQRLEHERTESARHYPDDDLVCVSEVAAWIEAVPAYGVLALVPSARRRTSRIPGRVVVRGRVLSNGHLSVAVHEDGRVSVDVTGGDRTADSRTVDDLISWESLHDGGDLYTASLGATKLVPRFLGARVSARGPIRGTIDLRWSLPHGGERVLATTSLSLDADATFLRVTVRGENRAHDHRLRLGLATGVGGASVHADAMFGAIERKGLAVTPVEAAIERPVPTAPLHRYVTLASRVSGATVFSDGLAEYEALGDGRVCVTLLRAVGELSRSDLPERPGHAGWPTATPGAQSEGRFSADMAIAWHGPRDAATVAGIEQLADDVLVPLRGETLRSALHIPAVMDGIALAGTGLAFGAAKPSDDGEWMVLRCLNLTDDTQHGSWTLPWPVREVRASRLDETPGAPLEWNGSTIPFDAASRAVVTILVRGNS